MNGNFYNAIVFLLEKEGGVMSSVFLHYSKEINSLKRNILKSCQETLQENIRIELQTFLDDWRKENKKIKAKELLEVGRDFLFDFNFEDQTGRFVYWYENYKDNVCDQIDSFFKDFKVGLLDGSVDKKMMHEAAELIQDYNELIQDSQCFENFKKLLEIIGEELYAELENRLGNLERDSARASRTVRQFVAEKPEPTDYDKEKFEQTLLHRYRNGMQFDSIDFESFREIYETLFGECLHFDDTQLEERLRYCGVCYKDRLFPAEGIIDNNTKEKLFGYIDSSFLAGKKVLYYRAIFEDLADSFANCFVLSDENMLRAYIEFTAEKGKYFFSANYMSLEKHVSVNHNDEVEEYLLNAGKPVATDTVCAALSHIPKDQVIRIITTDNRFLRNAKGEYFHTGTFEISDGELDCIAEIIKDLIEENGYAIWTDVWKVVQDKMPIILENNLYLSGLGVRNALAQRLVEFSFYGAVISLPGDQYAMRDIYQLYAKHHRTFSADDICDLAKELDTVIYFDALFEVSFRVSRDLFISKHMISLDVDAIDKAIESFISKDYIRIRDIDSFLVFPNVGYEWNEYLLESFVYSYSKKFSLLNNGFSLNNVAGAIVKKNGSIHEFVDACAAVLADGPISLNNNDAMNYLAEVNMITRRSYRDLEQALRKALQIRARKG